MADAGLSMVERVAIAIETCENRWSAEHLARAAIAAMRDHLTTLHEDVMEWLRHPSWAHQPDGLLAKDAADLIERQQQEIERLKILLYDTRGTDANVE